MQIIGTDLRFYEGGCNFKDCNIDPDVEYNYWVGVTGDASLLYGPVTIRTSRTGPGVARLELLSTNPVTDLLRFRVWPPGGLSSNHVSVRLFDIAGRFVRSLYEGSAGSGGTGSEPINLEWDTRDYSGKLLGSGIYFLKLEWQTGSVVRKVLVLRTSGGF